MSAQDTIYALATGAGRSAIAIVRISGPNAHVAAELLTDKPLPEPRILARRQLVTKLSEPIDDAMLVTFAKGASFTGEAMTEFHCHGGRAVISAVLDAVAKLPDMRLAEPGEFTRRGFTNGCMDLSAVEGLADLISAETELQRKQAIRIANGAVATRAASWKERLTKARGLVELTIDWADEEVPEDVTADVRTMLDHLIKDLRQELELSHRAEKIREGYEVAIIGPPNVGKSSLLNALAGRDVAIISDVPGTTRDVLEVSCDLNGLPVRFLDTAGLRETEDAVEQIGVSRAMERAEAADLRLHLRCEEGGELMSDLKREGDLVIWSKADLKEGQADLLVSAKSGRGMDDLLAAVSDRIGADPATAGLLGHHRQQQHVKSALGSLECAREGLGKADLEVIAEDMRAAGSALERLVGRIDVEDVLGSVFASFCLGK